MTNATELKATAACERITGDRFCTGCQKTRKMSDGGIWKVSPTQRRWICAVCVESRKAAKRKEKTE